MEIHEAPVRSVLFIGNSLTYFNGGVHAQVAALRRAAGVGGEPLRVKSCVKGGADLRRMWRKVRSTALPRERRKQQPASQSTLAGARHSSSSPLR